VNGIDLISAFSAPPREIIYLDWDTKKRALDEDALGNGELILVVA